jgi:hypothetical protein
MRCGMASCRRLPASPPHTGIKDAFYEGLASGMTSERIFHSHRRKPMKPFNLLLVLLGFASPAALAQSAMPVPAEPQWQSSGPPAAAGDARATEPAGGIETKTENGFTYACGGVGESEAAEMKSRAGDYDLMLTFATRKGEYLADVNVRIEGAKDAAQLQAMCGGPIMLVDMPRSGTYRIHAEAGGYTLNKTARIDTSRHRTDAVVMHWPRQIGESVESTGSGDAAPDTQSGDSGTSIAPPAGSEPPNPDVLRSEPPSDAAADPAAGVPSLPQSSPP